LQTSLSYAGETVDLDNKPAARRLVERMLTNIHPELKGGIMPKADIVVDLDRACSQCGTKGATQSGLCTECIAERIIKGGDMPGIRIELKRIEGINLRPKNGKIIVSLETYLSPGDIGRLFNLVGQGVPVSAIIESPQARMDLRFEEVDLSTGQLAALALDD